MKKRSLNPIPQGYNPVSYVWHSRWGGVGGWVGMSGKV